MIACKKFKSMQPETISPDPATTHYLEPAYVHIVREVEREDRTLSPFFGDMKSSFKTQGSKNTEDNVELLMLWHQKLGHRNLRDVSTIIGVPLPSHVPQCVTCIEAKSKRHPLTSRSWPMHDAPRVGYAFAWDHAGPFRVRTWGGHNYLSLKIDVFSKKLFPKMTNSVGTSGEEWFAHVRELNAHFGRQVVSRMITDAAPYFTESRLKNFNKQEDIIHGPSPPYT